MTEQGIAHGTAPTGARRVGFEPASGLSRGESLGGTDGNEVLTSAAAVVLTALLLLEGVTILDLRPLIGVHMFVGMVLIPPVLLKLASTGYRFVGYYTGSRPYREKGPPPTVLRLLAPVLVVTTVSVLVTGVWLLALGHRSDEVLYLHKASFIVWGAVFAIHFLYHLPRVARSLRADWTASRRRSVPGSSLRAMLIAASLGGGVALAIFSLSLIESWHGRHPL